MKFFDSSGTSVEILKNVLCNKIGNEDNLKNIQNK